MHKRNPFFDNPPDFDLLAELYPEFESCLNSQATSNEKNKRKIDFKNPEFVKTLYCVLMKHYFS